MTIVISALLLSITGISAAESAEKLPVPYTFLAGIAAGIADPTADPPGANHWSCKPSAAHPNPVVLTHGLMATKTTNWQTFAPLLANNGYCVFALTYGKAHGQELVAGLKPMQDSAKELGAFVDKVLAATGASRIDLVGHSEGTLMPSYYVRRLGGAGKIDKYVSLTPLWQGTSVAGLDSLYRLSKHFGVAPVVDGVINPICGSCAQLLRGSDFLTGLHQGGIFAPQVSYTNIVTKYDELVLPYTSGIAQGSNIKNIVLQDKCVLDLAEHVAAAADPVAAGHVLNALDPAHPRPVPCVFVPPFVG
jgi:triacylglycerol esterase/lipase EstA (alpha/beta hydrolase family)